MTVRHFLQTGIAAKAGIALALAFAVLRAPDAAAQDATADVKAKSHYPCTCSPALAVKTNVLYLAGTVANLGAEYSFAHSFSVDVPVAFSPYTVARDYKLRFLALQPEFRYWFYDTSLGHFIGIHANVGWFNVAVDDHTRYQHTGDRPALGFGISYGYRLRFNKHWGLEFTVGAGYANIHYDRFYNLHNGAKYSEGVRNYWGLTKLGVTLVYRFKL